MNFETCFNQVIKLLDVKILEIIEITVNHLSDK